MDKGVVETGKDVGNSKDVLAILGIQVVLKRSVRVLGLVSSGGDDGFFFAVVGGGGGGGEMRD